jgi:methylenetetrahydrofolate dehydrogenase (NADP+) / methenyltetrahydrofolate cyclohydrolase
LIYLSILLYTIIIIILLLRKIPQQRQHRSVDGHSLLLLQIVIIIAVLVATSVLVVRPSINSNSSIIDSKNTLIPSIVDSTPIKTPITLISTISAVSTRLAVATTTTTTAFVTNIHTRFHRTSSGSVLAWIPTTPRTTSKFRFQQTGLRSRHRPCFSIPHCCTNLRSIGTHLQPIGIATSIFLQQSSLQQQQSPEVSSARRFDSNTMSHNTNTTKDDTSHTSNDKIIDGKQIAATIREEIRVAVLQRITDQLPVPGLAVVLVGQRRDSQTYVNMKKKACKEAGIISMGYDFNETVTEEELLATIQELNHSSNVHGILIQLPLPKHLNQDTILRAVDPRKDVDGLHPINTAALQLYQGGNAMDAPFSIPCTPLGCLELLDRTGVELSGKHCVVIGRSQLVGLPMARLLLGRNATVTICHSKTTNPAALVSQADVVVVAIGKAQYVTADWIKPGAVVIDVGINSIDVVVDDTSAAETNTTTKKKASYKLVGDVHYEDCYPKCSKITPVPGGVGPMTIAMLLRNTLRSCERASSES